MNRFVGGQLALMKGMAYCQIDGLCSPARPAGNGKLISPVLTWLVSTPLGSSAIEGTVGGRGDDRSRDDKLGKR